MNKKKLGRVVLIHGVRVRKKNRNIHKLAAAFRAAGFCVVIPRYGYLPALLVGLFQWLDRRIADSMSAFIEDDDILLGHSNGGSLVYLISQERIIKGAILVNAALESDIIPNAKFVHVYYNTGDIVTRLSAFLPFHVWGSMGSIGYTGNDPRVISMDQGNPPAGLPPLKGHSDIFRLEHVRPWSRYMAELCAQEVLKLNRS